MRLTCAALAALLPVSLFLSSCAYADSAHAQTSSGGAAKNFKKVHFDEVKDLDRLMKLYPFLKSTLHDVMTDNRTLPDQATHVYVSAIGQEGEIRLFFLYKSGPIACGSHGCSLTVYQAEKKGYKDVLDAITFDPVYLSVDKTSLVTCGPEVTEWRFKDKFFAHPKPYTGSQKIECK